MTMKISLVVTSMESYYSIMIIILYYGSAGDLIHYITKDFYSISWGKKPKDLKNNRWTCKITLCKNYPQRFS